MDKDHGWEIIPGAETEAKSPDNEAQQSADMGPPKTPHKIALSPRNDDVQLPRSRKHLHEHGANNNSRRNTCDAADSVIQETDRAKKAKDERSAGETFSLQPETPYHYSFQPGLNNATDRLNVMPPSTNTLDPLQRTTHARDDSDVETRSPCPTRAEMDVELKLWRENAELRQALEFEKNRATQAERVADELRAYSRSQELQLQASMLAVANDTDALGQEAAKLRKEAHDLKAELDDARSHIFSLQPYRQELTPKEVEHDFDELVTNVSEWVQKFANPIIDDEDNFQKTVMRAAKNPEDVAKLRTYISKHPDLIHGCLYPETDVDILISMVLRYLNDNIFQKGLPGCVRHLGESIAHIEGSMQTHVKPQRDQFAIRTWRGEAFNAILSSPDYMAERKIWMKELTINLVAGFKLFRKDREFAAFCYSCQDSVVKPALALHEKLLTSTHHFYLDTNPFIVWNRGQELEMSADFFENLDKLQCDDILRNRKHLHLAKLDPRPTVEDLKTDLTNVMTVCPGLYMRQIGKGDAIKAPVVVRKQQVLVAYGSAERKQKFMDKGERTLMSHIYFGHKERERPADNPWAAWRQIAWG